MCSVCCEKDITYNFLAITVYSVDIHDEMHHGELSNVRCCENLKWPRIGSKEISF